MNVWGKQRDEGERRPGVPKVNQGCGKLLNPTYLVCGQITFNAETAGVAGEVLLVLKATTKARRHEESQRTFRVFVSSWLHFP
jgi:hypothetical protein